MNRVILAMAIVSVLLVSLPAVAVIGDGSDAQELMILFDFNDGRMIWVSVAADGSVYEATLLGASELGFEVEADEYSFGHLVTSIDGVSDMWWSLWLWNSSSDSWELASVAADYIPSASTTAVSWKLESVYWPVVEPLASPGLEHPWMDARSDAANSGASHMTRKIAATVSLEIDLQAGAIDTTPLYAAGVFYLYTGGDLWMGDAGSPPKLVAVESSGEISWIVETADTMYEISTPCIVGERIIVGSSNGNVTAFNRSNGEQHWSVKLTDDYRGISSSLTQYRGDVIATTGDGTVSRLHSESGDVVWSVEVGEDIYNSKPGIGDGVLAVGGDSGTLYFLNVSDGSMLGSINLGDRIRISPAFDSGSSQFYVIARVAESEYRLVAVGADRAKSWEVDIPSTTSSPVVTADAVFVSGLDYVMAFGLDGETIWSTAVEGNVISPVHVDGWLYMGTNEADATVLCLDASSGRIVWTKPLQGSGALGTYLFAPPSVSDGGLAFAGDDGRLRVFSDEYIEQPPWVMMNLSYQAERGKNFTVTPITILDNNSNPLSVWYDFGDGSDLVRASESEGFAAVHVYGAAGSFELTVHADDGMGNNVSFTSLVLVSSGQQPDGGIGGILSNPLLVSGGVILFASSVAMAAFVIRRRRNRRADGSREDDARER